MKMKDIGKFAMMAAILGIGESAENSLRLLEAINGQKMRKPGDPRLDAPVSMIEQVSRAGLTPAFGVPLAPAHQSKRARRRSKARTSKGRS